MTAFALNPRLEGDSLPVADLPLSTLRLMKDATYPWLLLIPRQPDLVEITDLEDADQVQLIREIARVSTALRAATDCEKLNVGALGNQVPQLHVHIIARFRNDAAWPNPVWGAVPPQSYEPQHAGTMIKKVQEALASAGEAPA